MWWMVLQVLSGFLLAPGIPPHRPENWLRWRFGECWSKLGFHYDSPERQHTYWKLSQVCSLFGPNYFRLLSRQPPTARGVGQKGRYLNENPFVDWQTGHILWKCILTWSPSRFPAFCLLFLQVLRLLIVSGDHYDILFELLTTQKPSVQIHFQIWLSTTQWPLTGNTSV